MGTCRVVIERAGESGVRNMAVDEALLDAACERGECTVRWYRWETATVSLGYFQQHTAAGISRELAGLPTVRRLTGGGAILHHHEWTYSCTVPSDHPLAADPGRIYNRVHDQIVAALAERGVEAALRGEALSDREGTFLCFGRGDPRDVVLGGHKIVGSAQRRRRGAVLQHGSVLFRHSEFASQFPGILDLRPDVALDDAFIRGLATSTGALFGTVTVATAHERLVETRTSDLKARYETLDWRGRVSETP